MARSLPTAAQTQSLTGRGPRHWVFGYGSLVDVENLSGFLGRHGLRLGAYRYGALSGFKAAWSVAMDNKVTLAGYRYYLDVATGARPEVFIAFANIERDPEQSVAGILFEAEARALAILDHRERNYGRTDVTAHFAGAVDGTVWTYLGRSEAGDRYRQGLATDTLVIDAVYAEAIERAFAGAGLSYTNTPPAGARIMKLSRVDT